MSQDNTLNQRQADPRSLVSIAAVQTLKHAEQLVVAFHTEADPIVPVIVYIFCCRATAAHYDKETPETLANFIAYMRGSVITMLQFFQRTLCSLVLRHTAQLHEL